MTQLIAFILALTFSLSPTTGVADSAAGVTRFTTVDIFLDTGDFPLAAYQLDFNAAVGDVRIVGIEGGEHTAFSEPPFYDPKAIQQERVILASFNTAGADSLPTGRTRIATVHLHVNGESEPKFTASLTAVADDRGELIPHALVEIQGHNP